MLLKLFRYFLKYFYGICIYIYIYTRVYTYLFIEQNIKNKFYIINQLIFKKVITSHDISIYDHRKTGT